MAHLPHVDKIPYTLEVVGRKDPKEHQTARVRIKTFRIGEPPRKKDLPVSAMPLHEGEIFCVYRAKKRPAIIVSKGGTEVRDSLTRDMAKARTNPTILVAPSYGRNGKFTGEFSGRVRCIEYPQFLWEKLPIGGREESIIRFDHIQPVGRSTKTIEFTPYCLSEKAMEFVRQWVDWLFTGTMREESDLCRTRDLLMSLEGDTPSPE
jgi:hypothetical protein